MDKKDIRFYDKNLGIDGTIEELLDWSYRYDDDFSDDALDFISEKAKMLGFEKESQIPFLVKKARKRKDGTLPYEQMKLDKLTGGKISYESTEKYGEVEIREENDSVIVSVHDIKGSAASICSVDEFMNGDDNFLETFIGSIIFYDYIPYDLP